MPKWGGYLRILQPAPTMCLDLDAWREFCGFDLNGCMADVEIDINSKTLEMTIELKAGLPKVNSDEKVKTYYFLNPVSGDSRIAGLISDIHAGKTVINIDPRRYIK
jgi:hypothetical protein